MLSLRAVRLFSSLVLAALFSTVLFVASVAVSPEPASAQLVVNLNCNATINIAASQTVTLDAKARGCYTGSIRNCQSDFTTSATSKIQSVSAHSTNCTFTIVAKATFTEGTSENFRIVADPSCCGVQGVGNPFRSHRWVTVTVRGGPASNIVFSAPASNPEVNVDTSSVLDVSGYASDGSYTISCGTATESSALISISAQTGCSVTVAAGSSTGTAVITVPYMSSGGDTHTAMLTVAVIDSNIVYTPPDITMQVGGALAINAASYATDGPHTITCGEVESKSDRIASITRNGCSYIIIPASAGQAEFTITYTSSGGDTHQATITITIEAPPSALATPNTAPDYTAPDYTAPADTTTTDAAPSGTTAPTDGTEEESALSWSTLTVQPGGTTVRTIRETLGLSSRRAIYAWNANTQTWTALADPTRTIPSGVVLSFRGPEEISREDLEIANIGQGTQQTVLAQGWNIINAAGDIVRVRDRDFLVDDALIDCGRLQGVIAVASYNPRTGRWSLWLPCHPRTEARLTGGTNPTYDLLTSIGEDDSAYIYIRSRISLAIEWNAETQTYELAP